MEQYDIVDYEEREVYVYGIELLLSTITGVLLLIIVSACTGMHFQWFPYLAGFIPLRLLGGGYHAKSHKDCILTFTSTYLICIVLIKCCQVDKSSIVFLSLICFLIIIFFSPVEAHNKELSKSRRTTNRTKSLVLGLLNTLITVFYASNTMKNNIGVTTFLSGYISAGLFMLTAVLTKRIEERK